MCRGRCPVSARKRIKIAGRQGRLPLQNLNIICGVASIENGYNEVADVFVLKKDEILEEEPKILEKSKKLMSRIYLDDIDVLIVNEIGKNISGTGVDTNIVGRFHTKAASGGPNTIKLGFLDISEKSGGNGNGMGLADFVSKKFYDKIDFPSTYINAMTSTTPTMRAVWLGTTRRLASSGRRLKGRIKAQQVLKGIA